MRSVNKGGAALLALGAAAVALLWRNRGARERLGQVLAGARRQLNAAGVPIGGNAGWPDSFRAITSQATQPGDTPGVLDLTDENLTVTERVRTNLGREPTLAGLPHLNVNTQERGVVYLRGYVWNEEQRRLAERVAANTEGVGAVVNELNIERAASA